VDEALAACASGRELVEQGWPDDVAVAAELDTSRAVPVLVDGAFTAYGSSAAGDSTAYGG
jgi:2-phosphosulfolactate phosphatase